MELKEFDLSKVIKMAQENQSKINKDTSNSPEIVKPAQETPKVSDKPVEKPKTEPKSDTPRASSFDIGNILSKVKANQATNKVDSKTAEMIRQSVNNYTLNKIQAEMDNYTPEAVEGIKYEVELYLKFATNGEDVQHVENQCKKYYNGYRAYLINKYNNTLRKEKELKNSPVVQTYNDNKEQIQFYEENRNQWKEETDNEKIKMLLNSISGMTSLSTMTNILDKFSLDDASAYEILASKPSFSDTKNFIDNLPDTDEDDPDYNKEDFLKNLSPETKNYFMKRDRILNSANTDPLDTMILNAITFYRDAREFVENNKEYKKIQDKIRQCQLIENNLKIQNRNLVQDFLDIEKLLHRKKKEFRLPDTSAIIVPRKAK